MISKNQIKEIRKLHLGKHRRKEQKFIVEAPKVVQEFIDSCFRVEAVFATKEWIANNKHIHANISEISTKDLAAISQLKTPNQVLAIVEYPEELPLNYEDGELCLVLDTIQDPGNLGTIIRIADWFGITKLIFSKETADAFNPKVVQATMGAITRVQFIYTDLKKWLQNLPQGVNIYGTLLDGKNIYESDISGEGIIVIGNESKGISTEIQEVLSHRIKIPTYGNSQMESLNAAIATALVCGEFRRKVTS